VGHSFDGLLQRLFQASTNQARRIEVSHVGGTLLPLDLGFSLFHPHHFQNPKLPPDPHGARMSMTGLLSTE